MTWLALRRRRSTFFVFLGLSLVLDFWMVVNGHTSANALSHTGLCQTFACTQPTELYAPARQAVVVDLLLLLLPLGLGLTLGVGLVAGEAERSTNRLVWTQDVTRTRWYVTSLAVSVGIAGVIAAVVLPVAHWWAGVAWVDLPGTLTLGGDRIQPDMFPVSGIVPLAYTVFAVTLGAAIGAVVRRVPWAAAVTVVLYLALAVVMVTTVRQGFAPTGFLVDSTTDSAQYAPWPTPPPWNVGYEYRVIPGVVRGPDAPPPVAVFEACRPYGEHPQDLVDCMRRRGVEGGFVTQSPAHYWRLQWVEALLYAGLAVVLAGVGLVAVRRTQD